MRTIQIIVCLITIILVGCGRSDKQFIQRGKPTTLGQPDGTTYQFTVEEFAPYQSEDKTLVGRAAILIAIVPVTGHPSLDIKKTTAVAKVRDGSTASLFGFRAFTIDVKEQSMRIGTLSTNKVGAMSYIRDTASAIGKYSVNDFWKNPTFTFEANNDLVFSFDLKGTNAISIGLILDAQFTNVQTVTVFGKALITEHLL